MDPRFSLSQSSKRGRAASSNSSSGSNNNATSKRAQKRRNTKRNGSMSMPSRMRRRPRGNNSNNNSNNRNNGRKKTKRRSLPPRPNQSNSNSSGSTTSHSVSNGERERLGLNNLESMMGRASIGRNNKTPSPSNHLTPKRAQAPRDDPILEENGDSNNEGRTGGGKGKGKKVGSHKASGNNGNSNINSNNSNHSSNSPEPARKPEPEVNINALPLELYADIGQMITPKDLFSLMKVSQQMRENILFHFQTIIESWLEKPDPNDRIQGWVLRFLTEKSPGKKSRKITEEDLEELEREIIIVDIEKIINQNRFLRDHYYNSEHTNLRDAIASKYSLERLSAIHEFLLYCIKNYFAVETVMDALYKITNPIDIYKYKFLYKKIYEMCKSILGEQSREHSIENSRISQGFCLSLLGNHDFVTVESMTLVYDVFGKILEIYNTTYLMRLVINNLPNLPKYMYEILLDLLDNEQITPENINKFFRLPLKKAKNQDALDEPINFNEIENAFPEDKFRRLLAAFESRLNGSSIPYDEVKSKVLELRLLKDPYVWPIQ